MIDLRSDTVTKPSPEMRRAMAEAVVGDDVFLEDPSINRLQSRAAQIFGREAALFVPSGSMGNLACVMAQTRPGQEVICETNGHVYNYEMGSLSAVGGVLPRIVDGEDGILSWSAIEAAIRPKVYYRPQTALICLENTVNMAGGTVYPTALANEICDRAHEREIHVHLDGARVFNAATYLKEDVADMTKKFDSVQFCLSKGLGAPVGSMIVGTRDFIERCRSIRKMLGGGMRQAGVLAAAGLLALEQGPKRLQDDHDKAHVLALRLAELPGIMLNARKVQTNIVIFGVKKSGLSSSAFLSKLADRQVLAVPVDGERVRMVTHLDVTEQEVEEAADAVQDILGR
jgi:threonine aldolase